MGLRGAGARKDPYWHFARKDPYWHFEGGTGLREEDPSLHSTARLALFAQQRHIELLTGRWRAAGLTRDAVKCCRVSLVGAVGGQPYS